MQTLTLTVQDIEILNIAKNRLLSRKQLSSKELYVLSNFLEGLPKAETLLAEKFPLDKKFDIKVLDINQVWPHLERWLSLFNHLPKNGLSNFPRAYWVDAEEDKCFWKKNVIIEAAFIPSLAYSKKNEARGQIVRLALKTDGTAIFRFSATEDAEAFPDLYLFDGSWKEAYILTVKTLRQGWPQTKFPKEFEPFLKK